MKFLQLDYFLHPKNVLESEDVLYTSHIFNAGEDHIKIHGNVNKSCVSICFTDPLKIMLLALAVDALRRKGVEDISLIMPYVPYGRQDRIMVPGEPLSIRVFANIINSLGFYKVFVLDTHSSTTVALLDNVVEINQMPIYEEFFNYLLYQAFEQGYEKKDIVFISPDAGASKKVEKIGKQFKTNVISCSKIRNVSNGEILGTKIHAETTEISGKLCVIMDDICDGGRTFTEIAKELLLCRPGNIVLYTTHGIYSKGLNPIFEYIDEIHTTINIGQLDVNIWPLHKSLFT